MYKYTRNTAETETSEKGNMASLVGHIGPFDGAMVTVVGIDREDGNRGVLTDTAHAPWFNVQLGPQPRSGPHTVNE